MEGEESTTKDSARSESEAKIKEDEIRTEKEEERKTPEIERKISPENEQNETPERSGSRQSRKDNDSPASGRKSVESRPKSSESIDRPKSTASNTSIGKTRRGKKGVAQDVTHSVTFKITVSVAVPTGKFIIMRIMFDICKIERKRFSASHFNLCHVSFLPKIFK